MTSVRSKHRLVCSFWCILHAELHSLCKWHLTILKTLWQPVGVNSTGHQCTSSCHTFSICSRVMYNWFREEKKCSFCKMHYVSKLAYWSSLKTSKKQHVKKKKKKKRKKKVWFGRSLNVSLSNFGHQNLDINVHNTIGFSAWRFIDLINLPCIFMKANIM